MPPSTIGRGGPTSSAGRGKVAGKTLGRGTGAKRYRKILRDTMQGISVSLVVVVSSILGDAIACVEYRNAKTVTVSDVLFALRRQGRPIYGFDPETWDGGKKRSQD
ncbi:hypothetical protein S7711_00352 [Stachybotrys chartarum IBT 7711]|uniref:Histone H4 n=1 Tax=Stachybotrys chartarum (strain CBS 109288 / IBT 7711) TaxID=1280523 RepID=A0A084B9G3_STACB|nr:hypothetical protein S7711_00352 [Stachybotrys chartarum IBT 7711]KFA55553.1 hypothetical protein S40293_02031 [Stachybotrys chartarum IBT 40293]KFA71807.1 hypothetical protein S40288_09675 [Stachybotrys chartarum IBT 40288]